MAVSNNRLDRRRLIITNEPKLCESLQAVFNQLVQFRKRDRDIIFVGTTKVTQGLSYALTPVPDGLELSFILSQNTISDNTLIHDILQERFQFGYVVLCIGAAGFD